MSTIATGSESTLDWLTEFYAASDTRDASLWVDAFFTDDAAIDFGNHPTVRGKENIRPWVGEQFPYISLIKHEILEFHEANNSIYHSLRISYRVKDDPEDQVIPIRAFAIAHRRLVDSGLVVTEPLQGGEKPCGGLRVDKFEVWLDKSPVAERISWVSKMLGKQT
ncbi:uncharacterized protein STEHIDRAFT_148095 [Stereum hirsutum FP-91666 SS1]|uniref:uncharacterized protein n=1 Tax=Stereum hirsutum (strain FP-91666) TaxID=721885 RepID=UPI00044492B8|nr:uncharacterized protein STEHIDRAFT_148095 [Stereum hirsutum FP-91666 SS1]EIM84766.1 hypothetical protein STEHIDRAFT_148095 [Stereum hirsutum FP-91666 SS1]